MRQLRLGEAPDLGIGNGAIFEHISVGMPRSHIWQERLIFIHVELGNGEGGLVFARNLIEDRAIICRGAPFWPSSRPDRGHWDLRTSDSKVASLTYFMSLMRILAGNAAHERGR